MRFSERFAQAALKGILRILQEAEGLTGVNEGKNNIECVSEYVSQWAVWHDGYVLGKRKTD